MEYDKKRVELPLPWKKAQAISAMVAALLIPVVLAFFGQLVNTTIKESELRLRYVELAASILKEKPTKETTELRQWAIDVLNDNSSIKFSKEVEIELKKQTLSAVDTGKSLGNLLKWELIENENGNYLLRVEWLGRDPLTILGVDVVNAMLASPELASGDTIEVRTFALLIRKSEQNKSASISLKTDYGLVYVEIR